MVTDEQAARALRQLGAFLAEHGVEEASIGVSGGLPLLTITLWREGTCTKEEALQRSHEVNRKVSRWVRGHS